MTVIKWILPLSLLVFSSCKLTKSGTTSKKGNTSIACSGLEITNPHFSWMNEKDDALNGYTEKPLPKDYKVYSIDSTQLVNFFTYAKTHPKDTSLKILIPLPSPIGCQLFVLPILKTRSNHDNTFEMTGMWGTGIENKDNKIKINYDGKKLLANVIWDHSYYSALPINYNEKTYYIIYLRKDMVPNNNTPKKTYSPKLTAPLFDK
jgi:hypothetical protein